MRTRRKILMRSVLALLAASLPITSAAQDGKRSWNFDAEKTGAIAAGFTNEVGAWEIVADESAPSKANVMAQLKNERPVFNVALASGTSYANVDITVKLRSIAGQIDQGGGVVWRARDAKNYYIARYTHWRTTIASTKSQRVSELNSAPQRLSAAKGGTHSASR